MDDADMGAQEPLPKAPKRLPASLGLSVLVPAPAPGEADVPTIRLSYAEYAPVSAGKGAASTTGAADPGEAGQQGKARPSARSTHWRRVVALPIQVDVPLDDAALRAGRQVAPGSQATASSWTGAAPRWRSPSP